VTFDASQSYDPDGNVTGYYLDPGDGSAAQWLAAGEGELQEHTYNDIGEFSTSLRVKDDGGQDGTGPLESTNEMEITITVEERPPAETQVEPSERSIVDFDEAFAEVRSSPLSEPMEGEEPEIAGTEAALEDFDIPDHEDVEFENISGEEPPAPGEFDPGSDQDRNLEQELEQNLEVRDLEDANAGPGASRDADALPVTLSGSLVGYSIDDAIIDELGESPGGALDDRYNGGDSDNGSDDEDVVGIYVLDELSGTPAAVFDSTYMNDSFGKDDRDESKNFSYRASTALNISAGDSDGDGNAEVVHSFTLAYEAMGSEENPTYESFYTAELRMFDNDSDGNVNYFSLNEFGFESYDGNGDAVPEYSFVHVRTVMFFDNDSDGNPEYAHALEVNFVALDSDSDGVNEYEAAHFSEMRVFDPDSDGNPGILKIVSWGFKSMDADNDSNPEYAVIYGEKLRIFDNDSDGNPGFARYELFGYGYVDSDSDGEPEMEMMVFKEWSAWDGRDSGGNQTSDGNPEIIRGMEAFFLHSNGNNFTMAVTRSVELYDNGSTGDFNYMRFSEWAYAVMDNNSDGNPEFEAIHLSEFKVYNNDTSNGNPGYVGAFTLNALMWDADSDREPDGEYYSMEVYAHIDRDEDGEPEESYHWKYEGDGKE